jgi:FolB domain-containing protein
MAIGILSIKDLALEVHLGVTPKERLGRQSVILNLDIFFPELPLACTTDRVEDTVCYDTLIKKIRDFCLIGEYRLIEFFGNRLYSFVKINVPSQCNILLAIEKHPEITGLGGSVFSIDDRVR